MTPESESTKTTESHEASSNATVQSDTAKPPVEKEKRVRRRKPFLVGTVLLALLAGFGGSALYQFVAEETGGSLTVLNTANDDGNKTITPNEESIAAVAKAVSPSVVSILTSTERRSSVYDRNFSQEGAGTGMIVSSNGYILTNKHVVEGADTVSVVLPSGKTYSNVNVVGSDPLNDVAFLKIRDARDLPAVTLGDSKTIRIGQSVVAIGNALGQYQNSVTSGIVSGTGRPVVASDSGGSEEGAESLNDLVQTDAAINSGNSGGPLLNLKGQVIGINTAVAANAQGIGFAIPISATKGLLTHLIKTGKVERAYLGVQFVSITADVKEEYDLPVIKGDYVRADRGRSVQSGGPADKAGIKDGDIITAINESKVGEVASISSLISEYEPGQEIEVTVLRDGRELKLKATLGTYEG